MSILYLVRHGQGGTREDYDSLSERGRRQARLLREYFSNQNIEFEAVYTGSLSRQTATAEEALPGAQLIVDSGWDEFDLARVYSEFAPQMAANDVVFHREYEEMQRAMAASEGVHDAPVHRRWNDCDKAVVRAWVEGHYQYSGESWSEFEARIHAALARVTTHGHDGNVAVFTSATPIGICAARALEIQDGRAMWLAGVQLNTAFSTLRVRGEEVRLFSFNTTPHLNDASLRTFR